MRLIRIRPHYFRAFGDSEWINLNSDLVVIYGPNGFGKTSLAEALEWLLYGKTHRRKRGEELSQRDYQGSYRNAHAPEIELTFVECELLLSDGSRHAIRRELNVGNRGIETSVTLVDGNASDLTVIGISGNEVFYPLIAQHSLQDFIHSRPKDRRDKISAAFGLEPLVRYKTAFDRARTRFQSSPPAIVNTSRRQRNSVLQSMAFAPALASLRQKWTGDDFDPTADAVELLRLARDFLGSPNSDWDAALDELTRYRTEAARRIFDTSPIQSPPNLQQNLQAFRNRGGQIHTRIETLSVALGSFAAVVATIYSQVQLQFWQTGLALMVPANPDFCPMCESETLTVTKRTELQERIDQSANYTGILGVLRQECNSIVQFIQQILRDARILFPTFLSDQQRGVLLALFGGEEDLCNPFLNTHDSLRTMWEQDERTLETLAKQVQQIPTTATDATTLGQATAIVGNLETAISSCIDRVITTSTSYDAGFLAFLLELQQRISSTKEIREIDAYLSPLNGWRHIEILSQYQRLLLDTLDLARRIESHIQNKQSQCFSTKGQEINRWYDIMNRGAQVRYKRMEHGTDSLQLIAETFGVEVNAVSHLSQCQLNCLGLSVHFARFLTSGNPFGFLLMDDPVQSMDDDHRTALVIDVINELVSIQGIQLIVLSHVQGLADELWERYLHTSPLRLRILDFQQTGPIIDDAETLEGCIIGARRLARGNEDNRRLAVKTLRRAIELLIRATCRLSNSTSPPAESTARQMLPFFQLCPNTTAPQYQDLSSSITFSDPAPHTQTGWAVPTQQQILPHIDRVRSIAQTLNVL